MVCLMECIYDDGKRSVYMDGDMAVYIVCLR
jgi:hypothetical protein